VADSSHRSGGKRVLVPSLFAGLPPHWVEHNEERLRAQALLEDIPLFQEVPPHRLSDIVQVARRNSYAPGDKIVAMGELGSTLHVIRSGRVNVVRESESGEAIVLASLGPGEYFGELSLFDSGPRSATVIAAEQTETLSIGRADILQIVSRHVEVAVAFLTSLSARLRTADNLLETVSRGGRSGQG